MKPQNMYYSNVLLCHEISNKVVVLIFTLVLRIPPSNTIYRLCLIFFLKVALKQAIPQFSTMFLTIYQVRFFHQMFSKADDCCFWTWLKYNEGVFPHADIFQHFYIRQHLKTLLEKKKLLIMSNSYLFLFLKL